MIVKHLPDDELDRVVCRDGNGERREVSLNTLADHKGTGSRVLGGDIV